MTKIPKQLHEIETAGTSSPLSNTSDRFGTIKQGTLTNTLAHMIPSKSQHKKNPYSESPYQFDFLHVTINLTEEAMTSIKTQTLMMFDILVMEFNKQPFTDKVQLSLDKYMEYRGLHDRREASKQFIKDLYLAGTYHISTHPNNEKDRTPLAVFYLAKKWICVNKKKMIYEFYFNDDFSRILGFYCSMKYPFQILRFNTKKNPHAYFFGRKLAEYAHINRKIYTDLGYCIISVKALISSSPFFNGYEKIMTEGTQHFSKRILKPFERDLSALDFIKWEYCHAKGTILSDEELANFNYALWEKLYIKYSYI